MRAIGAFLIIIAVGCVSAASDEAIVAVHSISGSHVAGVVRFSQQGDQVRIVADIAGLSPNGKHAFHIHEYGDCTAADGSSAGGHYNPEGHDHAGPETNLRHAGDLGNLQADAAGKAHYELTVANLSIDGDKNPIIGRSIIIHAKDDDFTTQPTGNAGGRIACGVIGIAKPHE
jgi:Cu-Zn family superoxide dismutase